MKKDEIMEEIFDRFKKVIENNEDLHINKDCNGYQYVEHEVTGDTFYFEESYDGKQNNFFTSPEDSLKTYKFFLEWIENQDRKKKEIYQEMRKLNIGE